MCRRSCCDKPGGQGAGVATVALIIGVGIAVSKIRPEAVRIMHGTAEVLRVIALTAITIVAAAIASWMAARLVRWWLRHQDVQPGKVHPVAITVWPSARLVTGQRPCLACGGHDE